MFEALLAVVLLATLAAPAHTHLDPVTGACGELDTELIDASPHLIVTDVGVSECDFIAEGLSPGGLEMLLEGTAGGSSIYSEILAHEIALQCEQAGLLKTETEIIYTDPNGKKTDILVMIDGIKIGISVTRAIVWPPGTPLSPAQAQSLLEDKLSDIIASSLNVDSVDAWQKQILLVETPSATDRDLLLNTVPLIGAGLRDDTIVWVVQTDGEDDFLYFGPEPECEATSVAGGEEAETSIPAFALEPNAPNPFSRQTTIRFLLPREASAKLDVYDVAGRRVKTLFNGMQTVGSHAVVWNRRDDAGRDAPAGVYFYRLTMDGETLSRKMVLNK